MQFLTAGYNKARLQHQMALKPRSRKFTTRTHKGRACFSVPISVQDYLGIPRRGNRFVKLIVHSRTGDFRDVKQLKSGSEIYGRDINESGITKNQRITVIASRPDRLAGTQRKNQSVYLFPSEVGLVSLEGRRTIVQVNRFERDPAARRRCIQIFGTRCVVCGFDFAKTYGEIGAGFIHVHHLKPLSMNRKKHRVA